MNSKSLIIKQKLNPIHRLTLSRPKSSRIMNDDSVFADLIKMCNSYVRHILFTRGGGGGRWEGAKGGGLKSINTMITKCLSICIPPPSHRGKACAPSTTIYLATAVPRRGLAALSKASHRIHNHFY